MKQFGLLLVLMVVCVGCASSKRFMEDLEPAEMAQINELRSAHRLCQINEIDAVDDGNTNIEYVKELVTWKCSKYAERIKDKLYNDFKVDLGTAWSYANDIRQSAVKEVTEAIMMRRRTMNENKDQEGLLRK